MSDKEGKVAGAKTKCRNYKIAGPGNRWFPRIIQADLAEKYEALWEEDGVEFEEIDEAEMTVVRSTMPVREEE